MAATVVGTGGASIPADPPMDRRRLIAFFAMVFGMFMAILDIQIVSASLAEIQAGLSVQGSDEIAVGADLLPDRRSGHDPALGHFWRASLSTRVLFATGFGHRLHAWRALLCATATTIDQMIVYRAIQGFIGGGMIPERVRRRLHALPAVQAQRSSRRSSASSPRWRPPSARRSAAIFQQRLLLALAVPRQRRPRHHRRHRGVPGASIDFDKPDRSLWKPLRLLRA
jgi:hypothetical protein